MKEKHDSSDLSADHSLPEPRQIRLTPGALAPGPDLSEIRVEIEFRELIVNEIANIPGQIVVAVDERNLGEDFFHQFEALTVAHEGGRRLVTGHHFPRGAAHRPMKDLQHECRGYQEPPLVPARLKQKERIFLISQNSDTSCRIDSIRELENINLYYAAGPQRLGKSTWPRSKVYNVT